MLTFTIEKSVININEIILVSIRMFCLDGTPKAEKMSARCQEMIKKMVFLYLTIKMMGSKLIS